MDEGSPSDGQRYMPAGSILATLTVTGGTPPLIFVDPSADRYPPDSVFMLVLSYGVQASRDAFFVFLHRFFKVLKATPSTTGNQAWIINRVPFGLGKYIVPVTATDSKGLTGTQTTEITIV
ncbi:hypothetical protein RvY_11723 [Ramazzottius varieornatus]|uniref:Uncharacterized protein n=1 Tax=Ramazzottius varieornatus TaxID=947166 RepID=A0A1D1VJ34_RAMVA|nr:hypothetical protein RvY_11723 [Ramazzottius varieornatus]